MDKKIEEIAAIFAMYEDWGQNYGLMSGISGASLFILNYSDITQNNYYSDLSTKMLEKSVDIGCQGVPYHSYCAGLAGMGFLLSFLEKRGIIGSIITEDIDNYILLFLNREIYENHYDFLHGALGLSYYFISREHVTNARHIALEYTMEYIEKQSKKDNKCDGLKWSTNGVDNKYNISLSHGISSIVCILLKIYNMVAILRNEKIDKEKIKTLITGTVDYVLAQEIDKDKYGSYFPYTSIESERELRGSRLAWCYGDLGISTTLYQAGMTLNRQDWIDKSLEVLLYAATERRDLNKNMVVDAGLCHGTSGIGHIFYRMWWNTRMPEFKRAADYWFEQTVKMAHFNDGLAGFKAWHSFEHGGWTREYGLLEGISGIGLALLTHQYEIEPTWDECLLLS